jgi:hypothetical protein
MNYPAFLTNCNNSLVLLNTTVWFFIATHNYPEMDSNLLIFYHFFYKKHLREDQMIIHQREISYSENYAEFFEALVKAKAHMEKKYPEISVELMYNLAGQRGFVTIQTRYASLANYERIDAEVDKDEEYSELLKSIISATGDLPEDQFYRVIQSP